MLLMSRVERKLIYKRSQSSSSWHPKVYFKAFVLVFSFPLTDKALNGQQYSLWWHHKHCNRDIVQMLVTENKHLTKIRRFVCRCCCFCSVYPPTHLTNATKLIQAVNESFSQTHSWKSRLQGSSMNWWLNLLGCYDILKVKQILSFLHVRFPVWHNTQASHRDLKTKMKKKNKQKQKHLMLIIIKS